MDRVILNNLNENKSILKQSKFRETHFALEIKTSDIISIYFRFSITILTSILQTF